jgi:hypothetical protein
MSLKKLLQQALDELKWQGQIQHDDKDDTDYIRTSYRINDQKYGLLIVVGEATKTISLTVISSIKIPASRIKEAAFVVNHLNYGLSFGNLEISGDGDVYFRWGLDVEGSTPGTKQIYNLISAAGSAFSEFRVGAIGDSAFTELSGEKIIADYEDVVGGRRKAEDLESSAQAEG